LKTTSAGMAQGLFEAKAMEKQFVVGGASRVPWKSASDIRSDERTSTLVQGQMVTRSKTPAPVRAYVQPTRKLHWNGRTGPC